MYLDDVEWNFRSKDLEPGEETLSLGVFFSSDYSQRTIFRMRKKLVGEPYSAKRESSCSRGKRHTHLRWRIRTIG